MSHTVQKKTKKVFDGIRFGGNIEGLAEVLSWLTVAVALAWCKRGLQDKDVR
jgi:hypothetical protein